MQKKWINFLKTKFVYAGFFMLIAFYLFNGIMYLQSQSITSDEGSFYDYAKRYLKGHPERIYPRSDNSKMPVSVLNTIPRIIEQLTHSHLQKNDWGVSDIMQGRYITLFISVITVVIVFVWAKQLYGNKAGLFAAFLMSFCPNNLANAALVTTDSYSSLFLLSTMFFLWKFCLTKQRRYFLIFSIVVALSQLVKQSLFHLYVLIPLLLIIYYFIQKPVIKIKQVLIYLIVFIFLNCLIINMGYYFYQANTAIGEYHFMSHLFQSLQNMLPSELIIPLPKPFVTGLDMAKYYDQIGGGYDGISSFGKVTILNNETTGGSFWYYYFVSVFFKTPITYLILFIWSIVFLIRTSTLKKFITKEFFLLFPVCYFIFIMSFLYKTQCGIRHLIFIFPFIFILSSSIIPFINNTFKKATLIVLSIYLVGSVLIYWKNYYPYTNEFILDKKMAYAYVGAGNLEFLQGGYFFKEYMQKHPDVHYAPKKPSAGTFIITTEDYLDVWNRHQYDWIRQFKPSGQVAYNGLLIKVTQDDIIKK